MSKHKRSSLRFNFGFLLESSIGASRVVELDYPKILVQDLSLAPLQGEFSATRTSEGIYIKGKLTSQTLIDCSRCMNPTNVTLSIDLNDLYFMITKAPEGASIIEDDGLIDLAPLVRELTLLAFPTQLFCQSDCKGLCIECGQNFNDRSCDCEQDDIDPRFAGLRQLLDSDNE